MASKIFNGIGRLWRSKGRLTMLNKSVFSRPCPLLSGATGDARGILIISPLYYEISCNYDSISRNKLPTEFIQIKLLLVYLGLNS